MPLWMTQEEIVPLLAICDNLDFDETLYRLPALVFMVKGAKFCSHNYIFPSAASERNKAGISLSESKREFFQECLVLTATLL
jgi:hypothetical protein